MIGQAISTRVWYPPRSGEASANQATRRFGRRVNHLLGHYSRQRHREIRVIEELLQQFSELDRDNLEEQLNSCRAQFSKDTGTQAPQSVVELRPRAFALLAVAMDRSLGMTPYRVQLSAAIAMHQGAIVQLAPGEGKTLALALVAALLGWNGRPCHVVTANDYLAQRDTQELTPYYQLCGLTVATALPDMTSEQLALAYQADVVYATGKQLLADFLRDDLTLAGVRNPLQRHLRAMRGGLVRQPVMRGLFSAVVDEADSVLIDEANTPLIISGPDQNDLLLEAVTLARQLADQFAPEHHYHIDLSYLDVKFTDEGQTLLDTLCLNLPPLWRNDKRREELLRQALIARDIFKRDRHYVVDDGKVVIVDENTGRSMPGRSWSYGLHQAVEAREGVELTQPTRTMARKSFQSFFKNYHRLCGASGTLQGIAGELWQSYDVLTVRIPSRLPSRLVVSPAHTFLTEAEKITAFVNRTIALHQLQLPVLVGTRRISDSEKIANMLMVQGFDCSVLNAKEHTHEAQIVAQAGQPGRITVATNMAGRGTDIKITPDVAQAGGLSVLMFEPHESRRVDWQLFGRAGRQGVPGSAVMFVAASDDLIRKHLPWLGVPLRLLVRIPWCRHSTIRWMTVLAQWRAQRFLWKQRKLLIKRDKLLRDQLTFAERSNL